VAGTGPLKASNTAVSGPTQLQGESVDAVEREFGDGRAPFVARLLEGEPMSLVCREFGISRKTGYKIFDRY